MNNIIITVKRFLRNKNTVTILGILVVLAILYFGYNSQIQKQVEPITVPVAKTDIKPGTKITQDMIAYVKMPRLGVSDMVLRTNNLIIGKYSNYDTAIPEGSMFYKRSIVEESDLPDSSFTQVKEGDVVYNFAVTTNSTYGNSIAPGNKIDLYMKAENDAGQIMVAKLVENVEVLAVKDNNGRNVFENATETRTPAFLIFGVPSGIHTLLRKAEYMKGYGVVIFPVPHGGTAVNEGETKVSSTYLQEFIESKTVNIPEEEPVKPSPEQPEEGE